MIRAEAYIKANPERHLAEQTPDDVRRYLSDLGRIGRINDWQFRQSVDAIQKLSSWRVRRGHTKWIGTTGGTDWKGPTG